MDNNQQFIKGRINSASVEFEKPPERKKNNRRKIIWTIVLWILFVGLILASAFFYWQYREVKKDPGAASQAETKALITRVSKIMELPQDVDPTIATISNKDKLEDQDFFNHAENGDKILIYAGSKMAILYRPSTNKIIKVAPLVLDQEETGLTAPTNAPTNASSILNTSNTNSATP